MESAAENTIGSLRSPGRNTERSFPPYDTLQMMLAKCVAALAMAEMAAAMVPESLLALQAGGRR